MRAGSEKPDGTRSDSLAYSCPCGAFYVRLSLSKATATTGGGVPLGTTTSHQPLPASSQPLLLLRSARGRVPRLGCYYCAAAAGGSITLYPDLSGWPPLLYRSS
eukprot:COSAG01_NODE_8651_length_2706_cov_5.179831_4_plen_104_part_00